MLEGLRLKEQASGFYSVCWGKKWASGCNTLFSANAQSLFKNVQMFSRLKVHMKACRIPSRYVRFAWLPQQHCFSIKHCSSKVKIHWHHWENAKNVEYWWFSLWTLDQVNYWRIQGSALLFFFLERKTHPWFNSRPLFCLVEKKEIQLIILTLLKEQFY